MTARRPPRLPPAGDSSPTTGTNDSRSDQPSSSSAPYSSSLISLSSGSAGSPSSPASDPTPAPASRPGVLPAQAHLTDRDRQIADWLDRHGVLTTAQITAAARDGIAPTPQALRRRHTQLTDSSHLPHRLGANQFFINLYAHARHSNGTAALRLWWSERDASQRFLRRVRPDGHALWREHNTTIGLFL